MIEPFLNIGKIPELRRKLLASLGLLAIFRLCVVVPLPGVDLEAVRAIIERTEAGAMGAIIVMMDLFSGGGMRRASLLALGIMPYISASIIFQLLVAVVPALEKIAKQGETGRKKINQYTRYSTVGLCLIQSMFITRFVQSNNLAYNPGPGFAFSSAISLTAGTVFLMWLGEQIDEFGIGNGISLIIMTGIISRLPSAVMSVGRRFTWDLGMTGGEIGPERVMLLIVLFVFMVLAVIVLTQAQRRIPMSHARRTQEGYSYRTYLPLRVNMAGVISIIFAQSMMMVPGLLAGVRNPYVRVIGYYLSPWSYLYVMLYVLMIVFFSYFYTAIVFNPMEQADQFKQYGAFIPGRRPGRKTAEYLEYVMNRITLAGAIALAAIAVIPQAISSTMKVSYSVASFFGGTGLLIVVGVSLDVMQRIESYMMMQAYDGFLKSGKMKGRRRY